MPQNTPVIYFLVVFFALVAHHAYKRGQPLPALLAAFFAGYLAWHQIPGVPALVDTARKALGLPVGQELIGFTGSLFALAVVLYGIHRMFSPPKKSKK